MDINPVVHAWYQAGGENVPHHIARQLADGTGRADDFNPVLLNSSARPVGVLSDRGARTSEMPHDPLPLRSYEPSFRGELVDGADRGSRIEPLSIRAHHS